MHMDMSHLYSTTPGSMLRGVTSAGRKKCLCGKERFQLHEHLQAFNITTSGAFRDHTCFLQVEDLKRFIKLVHIYQPGQQPAGKGSSNVGSAHSLAQLFSS